MSFLEETINATLDANGQLQLVHAPSLPPGPVQVTIRTAAVGSSAKRDLTDVLQEIAAEQRQRGFTGRSAESIVADLASRDAEDAARDAEFEAARNAKPAGGS